MNVSEWPHITSLHSDRKWSSYLLYFRWLLCIGRCVWRKHTLHRSICASVRRIHIQKPSIFNAYAVGYYIWLGKIWTRPIRKTIYLDKLEQTRLRLPRNCFFFIIIMGCVISRLHFAFSRDAVYHLLAIFRSVHAHLSATFYFIHSYDARQKRQNMQMWPWALLHPLYDYMVTIWLYTDCHYQPALLLLHYSLSKNIIIMNDSYSRDP